METSLPILHHPKYGYAIDRNPKFYFDDIFKIKDEGKRDFCVYDFGNNWFGTFYNGKGLWFDPLLYPKKIWQQKNRPINHRNDTLISAITPDCTCRILISGLTETEAYVLEAYLILSCKKSLSKYGTKEWDRKSMVNKKRPDQKWIDLIPVYLKISDGDYARLIA